MAGEDELLAELSNWLKAQPGQMSISQLSRQSQIGLPGHRS